MIIGLSTVDGIDETFDVSTKSKSRILLNSLMTPEFIVCQQCVKEIMSKLISTTKSLQGRTEDIISAYKSINALVNIYADMRRDVED